MVKRRLESKFGDLFDMSQTRKYTIPKNGKEPLLIPAHIVVHPKFCEKCFVLFVYGVKSGGSHV